MNRVNLLANDQPSSAVKMATTGLTTSGMKRTTAIKGLFSHFMFLTGVLLITLLTSGKAMAQGDTYTVTIKGSNITIQGGNQTLTQSQEIRTFTLVAAEGYKLPAVAGIKVSITEGGQITNGIGADNWSYSEGVITLGNSVVLTSGITVTVNGVAKSSDATLSGLKYSNANISSGTPQDVSDFDQQTISPIELAYNSALEGSELTITATTTNEFAKAEVTGNRIDNGTATVVVTVTAEDGTIKTYVVTFNVAKDALSEITVPEALSKGLTLSERVKSSEDVLAILNGESYNKFAVTTAGGQNLNLAVKWSLKADASFNAAAAATNKFTWEIEAATLESAKLTDGSQQLTGNVTITNIAANTENKLTTLTYQLSGGEATNVKENVGNDAGNQTYEVVLPVSTAANAEISIVAKAAEYATVTVNGQSNQSYNGKVTLSEGKATLVLTVTSESKESRTVTINFTTEAEQVTAVSGVPATYTFSKYVADANAAIALLGNMDMEGITLTANSGATLKLKWEYKGDGFDNGSGKTNEFTWTVVKEDGSTIAAKDGVTATGTITVTNYTFSTVATLAKLEYKISDGAAQNIAIADQTGTNIAITVPALPFGTSAITLTATASDPLATVEKVPDMPESPAPVSLVATPVSFQISIKAEGNTEFKLKVTAEDGTTTKTFTLTFSVGEEKEKITKVIVPKEYKLSETVNNANEAISLLEKMEGVTIETNGGTIMKLKWAYNNSDNGNQAYANAGGKTNVFAWSVVRDGAGEALEAAPDVEITGKTTVTNFIEPITGNDEKVEITKDNPVDKIGDGKTSTIITNVSIADDATTEQLTINNATISNALTLNKSIDEIVLNKAIIKDITLAIGTSSTLSLQSGNQIDKITNNGTLTLQEVATPAVATLSMAIETRAALDNTGAIKAVENNGNFTDNTASMVAVTGDADLSITSLPADKSTTGSKVTLSVGANSTKGTVSYQWQTYSTGGWANMSGSEAKDLVISKVTDGSTQYRCEVKSTVSSGSGQITTLYTPAATVTFRAEGSGGEPTPTPTPKTYIVKLAKVTGATFSQKEETTVAEGGEFSFKITLDKDYDQSKPVVTVDGKAIAAAADGSYTIKNIRKDIEIVVSGIVKNTATGMEETIVDAARAWSQGSTLYIHVPEKADVYVFNASGGLQQQLQGALGDHSMQLRAGFYIVRIGVYTAKVIIR